MTNVVGLFLGLYLRALGFVEDRTKGQGLVEYALILVLVSIAVFVALQVLGTTISSIFVVIKGDL